MKNKQQVLLVSMILLMTKLSIAMDDKNIAHKNDIMTTIVSAGIGVTAGITEVMCTGQLLTYAKNMMQQDIEISFNPRVFYRGFGINIACMAPTTAIQVATNKALENIVHGTGNKVASLRALLAGGLSAIASTPIELIILHQQNNGTTAYQSVKNLVKQQGFSVLARGIQPKIGRDAIFGTGFLSLYPITERYIRVKIVDNKIVATIGSSCIVGGITALVSHPFDTVSTLMQADYKKKIASSTAKTITHLYKKKGVRGLFKGAGPRVLRVILAIPLMNNVKEYLDGILLTKNNMKQEE